ncbi:hypothetical protein GCM10008179_25250 [Hansschlegelia plantiphila]|uniref:Uncharacterized protein n=2 Tax=Hansschlegelia plantiphila TaxID=374655 RepID=A0A9W6J1Z8_9HYPH|nr:hypothetical protein GCM10008179_25250 [Hansschlegelia plantiphila]
MRRSYAAGRDGLNQGPTMTGEMESLVLEQLRRIRASQDRMELDLQDVKIRVSAIEQHLGQVQIQIAGLNGRMDRFDERITRIERRLDLVDA